MAWAVPLGEAWCPAATPVPGPDAGSSRSRRLRLKRHRRCSRRVLRPHQRMLDTTGVLALAGPASVDHSLRGGQLVDHGADGHGQLRDVHGERARATLGQPLQRIQRAQSELACRPFALRAQRSHLLGKHLGLAHPRWTCHGRPLRPSIRKQSLRMYAPDARGHYPPTCHNACSPLVHPRATMQDRRIPGRRWSDRDPGNGSAVTASQDGPSRAGSGGGSASHICVVAPLQEVRWLGLARHG